MGSLELSQLTPGCLGLFSRTSMTLTAKTFRAFNRFSIPLRQLRVCSEGDLIQNRDVTYKSIAIDVNVPKEQAWPVIRSCCQS